MPQKIKMNQEDTMTFEEGFDQFLLDCKARNLREGTIRHYSMQIKQIWKYIPKETYISELNSYIFEQYKVYLTTNTNMKDTSAYNYCRDLKTIMRFFMKRGWMEHEELKLFKVDRTPTETYTDEELLRLLRKPSIKKCNFTEYKCWVIVNFLLSTGVRANSLIHIKVKDIEFDADLIHVNFTKTRKIVLIPMHGDIKKILQEYIAYRKPASEDDCLFCNEFGLPLNRSTLYHALSDYTKKRGVQKTGLHRFRHTFAKKWVQMGGNVVTLQKILGHSSLAITQNYLNLLVSDMHKDVEEFNIIREFKRQSIKMNKE